MAFSFRPAQRENVSVIVGIAGGSGSGKTYSALRIATGMAGGQPFALIDTEAGRAKHYADLFRFDHGDLEPPFTPERYADAIAAADAAGYPVVVVDSMSHEHAGDGGLLDWHDAELDRMAGDDFRKRDACNMAAWIKPKTAHKRMVQKLLQLRAHLILCFRAEPKIEMVKGDTGKWEIREKQSLVGLHGWIPVTEKTLPYELTVSFLLLAERPGVPHAIKLQEQHRAIVAVDQPLSEATGIGLAAWAHGGGIDSGRVDPATVNAPTPAATPAADDFAARIALATTKPALAAVGADIRRARLSAPKAAALRKLYDARAKTIGKPAAPVASGEIPWRQS